MAFWPKDPEPKRCGPLPGLAGKNLPCVIYHLAGVSTLCPVGHMWPRMAMDVAQHKIVNLLKAFFFFAHWFSLVFVYLKCVFNFVLGNSSSSRVAQRCRNVGHPCKWLWTPCVEDRNTCRRNMSLRMTIWGRIPSPSHPHCCDKNDNNNKLLCDTIDIWRLLETSATLTV